jgi:hypothetical protein
MFKTIVGAIRFVSAKPLMAAGLAACLSLSGAARADFNLSTGIDVTGNIDNNWTVTSPDVVLGSDELRTLDAGFPVPPWMPNTSASQWLVPVSTGQLNASPGTYLYTRDFTVSEADAGASLFGKYLSDNQALSITLQLGADTPISLTPLNLVQSSFKTWTNLDPVVLQAGTYHLTFEILNDMNQAGNPTGFRFEGGYTSAVPEPASLAMGALSTLALGGLSWKRRGARRG